MSQKQKQISKLRYAIYAQRYCEYRVPDERKKKQRNIYSIKFMRR